MATPSVLAFDPESRAIDFEVWLDDLHLFLQCDRADSLSLFDLTSGAVPAPAADADATVRSQWATRDAAARLAVRRHLPTSERAHFSQYKSAQTLYDAVVARYSSPATAALSRLMLPYLFLDLAAFPTVADLITHLRTSDARYRAALPADFCAKNPPPPSAKKGIVAVGASRGDPRTPIFEGVPPPPFCPLLPLLLRPTSLVLSRSVRRLPLAGDAALAGARGAGALEERAGAVEVEVEAAGGVGVAVGVEVGVGVSVTAVEAELAAVGAAVAEVVEEAAVAGAAAVAEAAEAAEAAGAAEAAEAAGVAVELVAGLRRGVAPVVPRATRARGARARVELEGAVAVAAVAAEGVGVAAGLVAGVVVVVAAAAETVVVVPAVVVEAAAEVEAAEVEAVEAAAEEAVVVEEVELVGVVPSSVAAVVVASAHSGSSSSARGTSLRLSSFVSGTLGVRGVGVLVPAPTFFVPATTRVSSVGVPTPPSAALAA
ncbi:unnamed protein product [Closterium sp. NIES-65]|nr:unnamed protein product [Closterium sp. NIES-65]